MQFHEFQEFARIKCQNIEARNNMKQQRNEIMTHYLLKYLRRVDLHWKEVKSSAPTGSFIFLLVLRNTLRSESSDWANGWFRWRFSRSDDRFGEDWIAFKSFFSGWNSNVGRGKSGAGELHLTLRLHFSVEQKDLVWEFLIAAVISQHTVC